MAAAAAEEAARGRPHDPPQQTGDVFRPVGRQQHQEEPTHDEDDARQLHALKLDLVPLNVQRCNKGQQWSGITYIYCKLLKCCTVPYL